VGDVHPRNFPPARRGSRHESWRCLLGLWLLVALVVFSAESARHSVHHLGSARADASCLVGAAGAHVCGLTVPQVVPAAPLPAHERADERGPSRPVLLQLVRLSDGRAPPSPVRG